MFASKSNTHTLPALALAAAFTLTACSDHTDPIAPRSESEPTPSSFVGLTLTPPALTAEMRAALGTPEALGPLLSTAATTANVSTSSASTQSLQVNGAGMSCQGNQVVVRAPSARRNSVQATPPPTETTWWYPVIYRWQGGQWVVVSPASQFEGWAYNQLPNPRAQWISYASRQWISGQASAPLLSGKTEYYAVLSWVYFGASQQWAYEWERVLRGQSVNGNTQATSYWCEIW